MPGGEDAWRSPGAGIPDGSAIITPNMMFGQIQALTSKIDELGTMLNPTIANMKEDIVEIKAGGEAREIRIRALEVRQWFSMGVASVVGTIGGWLLGRLI